MSKKAQGISINVVIVAAIALIVLVVLVAIFAGRLGIFSEKLGDVEQTCSDFEGAWQADFCGGNQKEIFTATDATDNPGKHCCVLKEST